MLFDIRTRADRLIVAVLGFVVAALGFSAADAAGFPVTTRSYDNARTGWNRSEPVLTPSTVTPSTFHKIGELRVDDKIEASPLYVPGVATPSGPRDLLVVATTNNTVYAFDAATHAQVWARWLGAPVKGVKLALYENWGITSTPVVDPDTGTLYVVRWACEVPPGVPCGDNQKLYRLFGLRLADGTDEVQSQVIDGFSVTRHGKFFLNGQQLIRTALALWRNAAGDKAVVFGVSGGEGQGPNGWVVAYSVARLRAGGNVTPAVWCSSPGGGGAGIWMAAQGPAIDEADPNRDIYVATGNGPYRQQFGADDLGESVVRLRFDPAANTLNVVDWFTPFTDDERDADHKDQDLGSAGVLLVPGSSSVLAGGKDGIVYNVNRASMGKRLHASLLQPPIVGTFTPAAGFDYLGNPNQATTTDGQTHSHDGDRTFIPHPADGGHTRHIHGGPAYFETPSLRLVYLMGENARLRAFQYSGTTLSTTPIAESAPGTVTSGPMAAPGGMPGGFLAVSSTNVAGQNGIVWVVAPRSSFWRDPAANAIPVSSILRAFNAIPSGGTLTELWNSEMDPGDAVGSASKWQPPLVANGRVYVATHNKRVVVYGITPPRSRPRDVRRTMVLIKGETEPGQDMFLRGGIDHAQGNARGRQCPTTHTPAASDPLYYNCAVRIEHRNTINYGSNPEPYPITDRWKVNDTHLDWYGPEEFQTYERLGAGGQGLGRPEGTPLDWTTSSASGPAVVRQGFGFLKENLDATLGDHYWMLDVDMDCSTALTIDGTPWFEVKSYVTNKPGGWEDDVAQADRPYPSGNHFAKCGMINIFERNQGTVTYRAFDTMHECSFPDQEQRCSLSTAQVCRLVGGRRLWQDAQNCVQSRQLCQTSTGACCTPSNGPNSNRNCR
jgi:outer membrane protein assembly factor BamB